MPRRHCRTIFTSAAAFIVLLIPAVAEATVSVAISGGTLTVTGTTGADEPRLRYYVPAGAGQPGYTDVFDGGGITGALPASCQATDPSNGSPSSNHALCEDGGSAASLVTLAMSLGDGNDQPTIEECFDTATINLGEGANRGRLPGCATTGTMTFTAGAGQDVITTEPGDTQTVTVNLGGGDDEFYGDPGATGPVTVNAGPGNDYLVGGNGNDGLRGEDGDDTIIGKNGNDAQDGGPGNDRIGFSKGVSHDDDQGNDDLRGGAGSDELWLDNHAAGMTITLNEAADDGSSGETDNVHNDFELIRGTSKNDTFTGGPGADRFNGGGGDDTIRGGAGDDPLAGGGGDDKLFGEAGADKVEGDQGADTVDGGPGADGLYGDIAGCSVFCSFDSDIVLARDDERDTVDCGGGADTAQVDALDVVAFCTVVERSGAQAPPPSGPPGTTPPPTVLALTTSGTPSIAKGTKVTVSCPAACTFTVTVKLGATLARRHRLGRKAVVIGTVRGALLEAGRKQVTVKLTAKARKRLKRVKKLTATLRVSAKDKAGNTTTKSRTITLRK